MKSSTLCLTIGIVLAGGGSAQAEAGHPRIYNDWDSPRFVIDYAYLFATDGEGFGLEIGMDGSLCGPATMTRGGEVVFHIPSGQCLEKNNMSDDWHIRRPKP